MKNKKIKYLTLAGSLAIATGTGAQVYLCQQCNPGTYIPFGGSRCLPCDAGTYQDISGQVGCKSCLPGTYSTGGATSCSQCPAGTYLDSYNATSVSACKNCPAGTYSDVTGATSSAACKACPDYQWSDPGSTKCGQVFVAVTISDYIDSDKGILNNYNVEWVNIESFIDNRYMRGDLYEEGFLVRNISLYTGDPGPDTDFGNFGTSPTVAMTKEFQSRDFLKGDCKTFPCTIRASLFPPKGYAEIDPTNKVIRQHNWTQYESGAYDNIYNAIVIDYNYTPGKIYQGKKPY